MVPDLPRPLNVAHLLSWVLPVVELHRSYRLSFLPREGSMPIPITCAHRAISAWVMAMVLMIGCATVSTGGSGRPEELPPDMDDEALEEGAKAEVTRTAAQIWAVARNVREIGAHRSFSFWVERGALTLVGYTATGGDGAQGPPVEDESLTRTLRTVLDSFAQQRTGGVELSLERRADGWTLGYARQPGSRPAEAKTLPVRGQGSPPNAAELAPQSLAKLLMAVPLPEGGEAQVEVAAHLEDGRVEEWELEHFELLRGRTGSQGWELEPHAEDEATAVVRPFLEGIGERTVQVSLRLARRRSSAGVSGRVTVARVVHSPAPSETTAEAATEYRRMVEDILRRWREDTKEGAQWVARRGVEELALWYAFGILSKGVGWLGARTLPTVKLALSQGGEAAAGWLRTTLKRVPVDRKLAFERLWMKVQLEGRQALSQGERAELRELMEGLEQLVKTPLKRDEKDILRSSARAYYKKQFPELAQLMDEAGSALPIHHRCPLEYAHLFPSTDINAASNLAMVPGPVHRRINVLWDKFRQARPQPTAREVEETVRIIDDHFASWYHRASDPLAPPLQSAEEAALAALRQRFPGLR